MSSLSNPNAYSGIVKNSDSGGSGFPVNITDPQEGQILTFDSENQEWVNSDSAPCAEIVNAIIETRSITQDEVDNYIDDTDGNVLSTEYNYTVTSLGVTLNDITGNKIYRIRIVNTVSSTENIISLDNVNIIERQGYYQYLLISFGVARLYVIDKNTELKIFSKSITPQ